MGNDLSSSVNCCTGEDGCARPPLCISAMVSEHATAPPPAASVSAQARRRPATAHDGGWGAYTVEQVREGGGRTEPGSARRASLGQASKRMAAVGAAVPQQGRRRHSRDYAASLQRRGSKGEVGPAAGWDHVALDDERSPQQQQRRRRQQQTPPPRRQPLDGGQHPRWDALSHGNGSSSPPRQVPHASYRGGHTPPANDGGGTVVPHGRRAAAAKAPPPRPSKGMFESDSDDVETDLTLEAAGTRGKRHQTSVFDATSSSDDSPPIQPLRPKGVAALQQTPPQATATATAAAAAAAAALTSVAVTMTSAASRQTAALAPAASVTPVTTDAHVAAPAPAPAALVSRTVEALLASSSTEGMISLAQVEQLLRSNTSNRPWLPLGASVSTTSKLYAAMDESMKRVHHLWVRAQHN